MFDRLGRLLCVECGNLMRAVEVARGEALFRCLNCNNCLVIDWPTHPEGRDRLRDKGQPEAA
jgi:hypothetical protein